MDTTDQGEGSSHTEKWIEESDAVVIVYNVSKLPWRSTPLKTIRKFHELVKLAKTRTSADFKEFPILVLGTMNDRVGERVLEASHGQALADELGCGFAECSALEGGIDELIHDLVRIVREQNGNASRTKVKEEEPRKRSLHKIIDHLEEAKQKAWIFG